MYNYIYVIIYILYLEGIYNHQQWLRWDPNNRLYKRLLNFALFSGPPKGWNPITDEIPNSASKGQFWIALVHHDVTHHHGTTAGAGHNMVHHR